MVTSRSDWANCMQRLGEAVGGMQPTGVINSTTPLCASCFAELHMSYTKLRRATQATDSRARRSAQEFGLDSLARTRLTSARPKALPLRRTFLHRDPQLECCLDECGSSSGCHGSIGRQLAAC